MSDQSTEFPGRASMTIQFVEGGTEYGLGFVFNAAMGEDKLRKLFHALANAGADTCGIEYQWKYFEGMTHSRSTSKTTA